MGMTTAFTAARVFGAALPALNCFVRSTGTPGTPIEMIGFSVGALGAGGGLATIFANPSRMLNVSSSSDDDDTGVFLQPCIIGPRFAWIGYETLPDLPPPDPQ